ncbi:MAG: ImpA family metalloprotease [Thiolinea sp.]
MKSSHILLVILLFVTGIQPVFADVSLGVKVWLQGAYDTTTGLMRDDLRRKNLIPEAQPYNFPPFDYSGAEILSTGLLATEDETAIVDWVLLELRSANGDATSLANKAVLLQRNGLLADPQSGENILIFTGIEPGQYRVAVRHRNHLAAVSQPVTLQQASTKVDFTSRHPVDTSRYQSEDKAMLWAGDADANARLISSGPGTDKNQVITYILTAPANSDQQANYILSGYFNTDLNLDGVSVFTGPGNDINLLSFNTLLHPLNGTSSLNYVIEAGSESVATITPPVVDPATLNIASLFGVATQGADYGSWVASLAIDDDPESFNHTQCNATDNWWQLRLPDPTSVARIVVTGRSGWGSRIKDAGVYLTTTSYGGTLNESDHIFTLAGTDTAQEIVLPSPVSGRYLIIKAADGNCLHMRDVEVYGETPQPPYIEPHEAAYLIPHASPPGTPIVSLKAYDWQLDNLSFSLAGQVPFAVDAQGKVTVNGTLQADASYVFDVLVSDGSHSTSTTLTVNVTAIDAVEAALGSGSISKVTDVELLDATLATITDNQNLLLDAKVKLFNLNDDGTARADGSSLTAIDWEPTHDASLLLSTYGMNTPVLTTNNAADGYTVYEKEIGIIGAQGSRYMLLGGNPMRNYRSNSALLNEQMHQFMENSLSWLSGRGDLKSAPFNVVIAHLDDGYWFPDERAVREWLDQRYPGQVSYNAANTCDDAALPVCLEAGTDLLIISQHMNATTDPASVTEAVRSAMAQGIPVLYLHLDGGITELGQALFPQFNVAYQWDNYWKKLKLSAFDITAYLQKTPADVSSIKTMLNHFRARDYAFDWSACDGENCSGVAGLDSEFHQGASAVRSIMTGLDSAKINLFTQEGFRLQKLLALLGDSYRQTVRFPMDKVNTDDNDFMRAYFADHAVYNYRLVNPAQPDMGNFSRSDFSHITPVTKTVDLQSKVYFRSAGVYALPGQTVHVTRLDDSDLAVKVFVNSLRSGSTHQWAANSYNRPKYLQSALMEVKSGETIAFTSPYGGPVQVAFSTNDLPVQLRFENVGEHPYWRSSDDDASFTAKLAAGDYDWAELVTPGFEVHSTLSKMRESVAQWGDAANLAARTMRHLYNFPHVLAGFQGPGIDVVPEIHDFATAKGLTIETLDMVKHMNADQATCGYGCSGNPYDAYWAFSPTGHGDIHELGHGLEKGRFRFTGWEGHSTTNPYSYYSKTQYYKETGNDPVCQRLPFESVFNTLQSGAGQADPMAYLQTNLWATSGWSQQVSMTIQMMMEAQKQGVLQDGWHLLARLHILEREFNRAKSNETTWAEKKDSLGFSSYTLAEVQSISNNDWMVVSASWASGLDYRAFIRMWGQDFSAKADAQVAGFAYPAAQRRFFISSPAGYCKGEGFDGNSLPVDGVQTWPLN